MSDNPYISEEVIAAGPSGKVYRGHDKTTGRAIRIKALLTSNEVPCPADFVSVKAYPAPWLALQHPQIGQLLAIDEHGDELSLISDYSPGRNVWDFTKAQHIQPSDSRALAAQLMMALQAGVALGLHHGDVKPSNVIIAQHPGMGCTLQLQDWGLAGWRGRQPHETMLYRAPELHSGGEATAKGDLFSAGATLATLLTGHPLVNPESDAEIPAEWARYDVLQLRQQRLDLDIAFHDWLAWLLRIDPTQRPASAAVALEALTATAMAAVHGYVQPLMPVYAAPVWQPTQTQPIAVPIATGSKTGPLPNKPKSAKAATAPAAAKTPAKKKRGFPIAIVLTLAALALVVGFFVWMISNWGDDWPTQLRKRVVAAMGGSIEPESTAGAPTAQSVRGRYVRVEIPGNATLNIAEVEVMSNGINIAVKGKASARDTAWGGKPEFANDGNTSGDWKKSKSIYHSKDNTFSPWWEVDLGSEQPIQAIKVWGRTDGDYAARLDHYSVTVSDAVKKQVWQMEDQPAPNPTGWHLCK